MIKNSFLPHDYTPIVTEEDKNQYDCPITKMVGTDHYRIDIDQDACNAIMYLNIGYEDLTEYDSPVYLSPTDALEIGNKLIKYATTAIQNEINAGNTRLFVSELEDIIKNKNINWFTVYPIKLADQDNFPGCMILDVHYFTKDDPINKHSARILSSNYLDKSSFRLCTELEDYLKETYDIESVRLFGDKFEILYNSILDNFTPPEISDEDIARMKDQILNSLAIEY